MKTAILGATRGLGRALARQMVERGDAVCVLGRSPEALAACARDLELRAGDGDGDGRSVPVVLCDLAARESFGPALDAAAEHLGGLDTVVVTAGVFASQDELEADPELRDRVLHLDFTQTVHFCEEARVRLLARGGGTLCVFSSVSGERARSPVVLYGAAKAGLSHYLEGLDHRYRKHGLVTVCIKPGFVHTGMTAGADPPPFAASPEAAARATLRAIDRGRPAATVPFAWAGIMGVVRRLPRSVLRRLHF